VNPDHTPFIASAGLLATLGLNDINAILSILVGAATLGYVITKWILLWRRRQDD
tara:strand:+ start:69 stop:230 length:162 start_codon:yes stop_codon:yes gene_type:complete